MFILIALEIYFEFSEPNSAGISNAVGGKPLG